MRKRFLENGSEEFRLFKKTKVLNRITDSIIEQVNLQQDCHVIIFKDSLGYMDSIFIEYGASSF
ncbi:hypothetical protein LEP1GSC163_1150 [Leptospira santarosai str. CBC379]|nr:hypothetical protein LEP1GSC163_1150 [Leptospira santarosai str. CBC379]